MLNNLSSAVFIESLNVSFTYAKCRRPHFGRRLMSVVVGILLLTLGACSNGDGGGSSTGLDSTGRGGSTARMTIVGDYMYAVVDRRIQVFDISIPNAPNPLNRVSFDFEINSLFPYNNYLLAATDSSIHIIDNSEPTSPRYISEVFLISGSNPVVAADGIAYVSQSSSSIYNSIDQMEILDIEDITSPVSVNTITMQNPSGLAIEGNRLFVCDDIAGIKMFDLSEKTMPDLLRGVTGVNCNDVIALEGILYAITNDALLQYNYNTEPPTALSELTASE